MNAVTLVSVPSAPSSEVRLKVETKAKLPSRQMRATKSTELTKLVLLADWLRELSGLYDTVLEWQVEALFSHAVGGDCPALEKDVGLRVLRIFGIDEALHRSMWKRVRKTK